MEAKYNWIIDSTPIRSMMSAAAFSAWFWVVFGLMFLANKG